MLDWVLMSVPVALLLSVPAPKAGEIIKAPISATGITAFMLLSCGNSPWLHAMAIRPHPARERFGLVKK
jgi:hypothetical protein